MKEKKEKRRGGARDDSEVYISYSRQQLLDLIIRQEDRIGISYCHNFSYEFKSHQSIPILWHKIYKRIRKHIDSWQQELPLF